MDPKPATWKCSHCGYTFDAVKIPEQCPACHKECSFLNATCYTPDCADGPLDERIR